MADQKALEQKYSPVGQVISDFSEYGSKFDGIFMNGEKLVLKCEVPSKVISNRVWDTIKQVDPNYQDFEIQMSVTGGENSAPLRVGYPVCDTVGGITAALAICAALVEARTSGQGRMIDVSMLESTIASMGWVVSNYLNAGVVPIPMGNENFTAAPSGTFQTADGLLNIAANEDYQFEKLCEVIGYPEL